MKLLNFVGILLFCQVAVAESDHPPPAWHPSVIEITQTLTGQPGRLFTKLEMAQTGDAKITYQRIESTKPSKGTILLISGRWMLVKDMDLEHGREIDPLDIAGLNSQLLLALLSKSLPGGPPASGETQHINFTEAHEPIRVGTASASGGYPAPWSVTGAVVSVSAFTVNYSLDFAVQQGDMPTMHLEGEVSSPTQPLELPDTLSLSEWTIHKIGPYEEKTSHGTILDYGAKPVTVDAKTLGELRALNPR